MNQFQLYFVAFLYDTKTITKLHYGPFVDFQRVKEAFNTLTEEQRNSGQYRIAETTIVSEVTVI